MQIETKTIQNGTFSYMYGVQNNKVCQIIKDNETGQILDIDVQHFESNLIAIAAYYFMIDTKYA